MVRRHEQFSSAVVKGAENVSSRSASGKLGKLFCPYGTEEIVTKVLSQAWSIQESPSTIQSLYTKEHID